MLPEPDVVTTKVADVLVFKRFKVHVPMLGIPSILTDAVAVAQVG